MAAVQGSRIHTEVGFARTELTSTSKAIAGTYEAVDGGIRAQGT